MSFSYIIWRNFLRNIKHYAIYMFSLVISTVLYFSFITIKYVHHLHIHESLSMIREGSKIGSYFLFIIIVVFIMYTNILFIKRRSYELGLLQIMGLNKVSIIYMFMLEQLFIFLITAVLGVIIGIVGSKILLMIILKLLGIHTSVSLVFSVDAIIQTLFILIIAYILIILQAIIFLNKYSVTQLMESEEYIDETGKHITFGEIILGILGIVFILAGYYLSTRFVELLDDIVLPFIILFLTVIGAYFFFRSSVSLITVSVLCFAAISRGSLSKEISLESPYEVTTNNDILSEKLKYQLEQQHIAYNYNYKQVVYTHLYKDYLFDVNAARPYSVTVTSEDYFSNVSLKKGQADLIIPEDVIPELTKHRPHGTTLIGTKRHHTKVQLRKVIHKVYFKESIDLGGPTLVLNNEDYQFIKQHVKNKDIISQHGFDLKHTKDIPRLEKTINHMNQNLKTRSQIASEISSLTGILLFISSFLGIAFLIATGCIIYIKQIDETEDELENYSILRKLGFTQKDMDRGLKLKVAFNFGLPLAIALLHAYFAALVFMKFIGFTNQTSIFIVMIIYTIVYSMFAFIAYNHSKRTINHSI